jgi:hypothetical protein
MERLARSVLPRRYRPEVYLPGLVRKRTGMVVIGGCFKGLVFPRGAEHNDLVSKLLGTYERELAAIVEKIVRQGFDAVVNIGAAEGYYAVGLARRIPGTVVHAFEADEGMRSLLRAMVAANGVAERVRIKGKCEPADLHECLTPGGRDLVVCDVEGYESVLLDPTLVPQLAHSYILVELHELRHEGITELLRTRFSGSHQIEQIRYEPRSAKDYPFRTFYTRLLPDRFLRNTVSEWRSEQQAWLWMLPL